MDDTRLLEFSTVSPSGVKRRSDRLLPCDLLPVDLMNTATGRSHESSTLPPCRLDGPNLSARIGKELFFRLLRSLKQQGNTRGILKLMRQVPSIINETPALSLSPLSPTGKRSGPQPPIEPTATVLAGLTTGASLGGVVDAMMSSAEGLLSDELSSTQQGDVLAAAIGLAVKQGSLAHCLGVVRLLFSSTATDNGLPSSAVGHHLKVWRVQGPQRYVE